MNQHGFTSCKKNLWIFTSAELLDSKSDWSDWSPEISPASTFSVPPGTLWTREMPPNHCAPRPTCEICWPPGNQDGKGKKKNIFGMQII